MDSDKITSGGIEKQESFGGIGTLSEKALHAALKDYFQPDKDKQEIKVGRYIADIATQEGIIEIQTRSFDKLRAKLKAFLEVSGVTVVYPIAGVKYICWIDTQTGEVTKKRKSPKKGSYYDSFAEIYKIKQMLLEPRLRLCLVIVDLTEYRFLNGWSEDKKKGSTRCERIPDNISESLYINSPGDYRLLIPGELPEEFTVKQFAALAHITRRKAGVGLNILNYVGAVTHIGKKGREYLYRRSDLINPGKKGVD
ncbi:MAG: hypothetical protein GX061_01685 [Eubacteriaceae bacterium]|nr:hypothetical protein [Eubacteriaceae bacterium]